MIGVGAGDGDSWDISASFSWQSSDLKCSHLILMGDGEDGIGVLTDTEQALHPSPLLGPFVYGRAFGFVCVKQSPCVTQAFPQLLDSSDSPNLHLHSPDRTQTSKAEGPDALGTSQL